MKMISHDALQDLVICIGMIFSLCVGLWLLQYAFGLWSSVVVFAIGCIITVKNVIEIDEKQREKF